MKYSTKFSFDADVKVKDIVNGRKNFSVASIQNLKPLADISVSSDKLIPIAFDLGVANMFNRNGDGTDTIGAKKIIASLANQPLNMEHNKYDIVGHIINAAAYSKPDHNLLKEDTDEPFYISVGAILYKIVNSNLVDFVKWENEEGTFRLGASWEVGFDDYIICRGSNLLSKCSLHSNEAEIEKYSQFLLCNGGTGFDDEGIPVFRLIKGEVEAVGSALTFSPAAAVKGVYMLEKDGEDQKEDSGFIKQSDILAANEEKNKKVEEIISQSSKKNVEDVRDNMNLEQIKAKFDSDIKAIKDENKETLISTASSTAFNLIDAALKDANEKYVKEKESLANLQKAAEAKTKELEDQMSKATAKLADIEKQLSEANDKALKAEQEKAERIRLAAIDGFMADVDSKYNFSKEQRDIVLARVSTAQVQDPKVAEALKNEYSVLFASLVKTTEGKKETAEEEISKASVKGGVVTNVETASKNLKDKIKDFKFEVEIK